VFVLVCDRGRRRRTGFVLLVRGGRVPGTVVPGGRVLLPPLVEGGRLLFGLVGTLLVPGVREGGVLVGGRCGRGRWGRCGRLPKKSLISPGMLTCGRCGRGRSGRDGGGS
jgi:hypothetical protein